MKPNIASLRFFCRKINFFASKNLIFSAETDLSLCSLEVLKILSFKRFSSNNKIKYHGMEKCFD